MERPYSRATMGPKIDEYQHITLEDVLLEEASVPERRLKPGALRECVNPGLSEIGGRRWNSDGSARKPELAGPGV